MHLSLMGLPEQQEPQAAQDTITQWPQQHPRLTQDTLAERPQQREGQQERRDAAAGAERQAWASLRGPSDSAPTGTDPTIP